MPPDAAVGIVPHTGWAWLVKVSGAPEAPRVDARARVVACDVVEGQLYHRAAERRHDAARFLAERRAAAVERARAALEAHVGGVRAAVVLGGLMRLPALERILAAHPRIHSAEGELWRALFAEACAAGGLAVTRARAEEVHAALAERHGPRAVAAFLAGGKRAVGSPWSREPQDAALAAWSALAGSRGAPD